MANSRLLPANGLQPAAVRWHGAGLWKKEKLPVVVAAPGAFEPPGPDGLHGVPDEAALVALHVFIFPPALAQGRLVVVAVRELQEFKDTHSDSIGIRCHAAPPSIWLRREPAGGDGGRE